MTTTSTISTTFSALPVRALRSNRTLRSELPLTLTQVNHLFLLAGRGIAHFGVTTHKRTGKAMLWSIETN